MAELADREHRISGLERTLEEQRHRRLSALEAVDRIHARVEALQAHPARRIAAISGSGGDAGGETEDASQ